MIKKHSDDSLIAAALDRQEVYLRLFTPAPEAPGPGGYGPKHRFKKYSKHNANTQLSYASGTAQLLVRD